MPTTPACFAPPHLPLALAITMPAIPLALHAQAGTIRQSAGDRETIIGVKTVGGPELSPDGKWVAYTVSSTRRSDERQHERSVARRLRRIVAQPKSASAPTPRTRPRPNGSTTAACGSRATVERWCSIRRRRSRDGDRRGHGPWRSWRRWRADGRREAGGGGPMASPGRKMDGRRPRPRRRPSAKRYLNQSSRNVTKDQLQGRAVRLDGVSARRGALPASQRRRSRRQPAAGDLSSRRRAAPNSSSRTWVCVPTSANWNRDGTHARVHGRLGISK